MPQTIVEKIAQTHLAEGPNRPLRTGDFVSIRPHRVMTHDNTSAVMSKFKGIGAKKIHNPQQLVFALDHDIQNQDEANRKKYRSIEAFAKEHGVDFYPAGSGIGHQIMVERSYVIPGSFVVASDSHSNMYGALGAIGTPIVRTDAAAVWATGEFWWQIPRSVEVRLEGKLPEGATGKDVIITLCGLYNHDEVLNAAIEFSGPGVASLSMDARLSISNMTTEWGPLVGWFPVDDVTIAYMPPATEFNYYIAIGEGIKAEAAKNGIKTFMLAPQSGADINGQMGMIQDAITRKVSAIVLSTHDENAAGPLVKRLTGQGIAVVIVNSDIAAFPSPVNAVVGYNQRKTTHALGEFIAKKLNGKAVVGVLEGGPGYHSTERVGGSSFRPPI